MSASTSEIGTSFGRRGVTPGGQSAKPAIRPMYYAAPTAVVPQPAHSARTQQADDRQTSRATKIVVSSQFASKPPLLQFVELVVLAACTGSAVYMMFSL